MEGGRSEVVAAGKWLVAQRKARGGDKLCPQNLVATLAQKRAKMLGEPLKLKQQQISEIERAREDNEVGPKKGLPHWWRHIRWLFDSGEMDSVIEAVGRAGRESAVDRLPANTYLIQGPNGEIVGRLVWTQPPTDEEK